MKRRLMTGLLAGSLLAALLPATTAAAGPSAAWTRQFGSAQFDTGYGIATDAKGNQYVVGMTAGTLGKTSAGESDAFIRKVRQNGKTVWTRQFGSSGNDAAYAVAVDRLGRIYVAGQAQGVIPGQTGKGDYDAFVRRYRPNGKTVWTRQFGTSGNDAAFGLGVDRGGRIYVVGRTGGVFPGQPGQGGLDAFIRKLLPSGRTAWTRQFGTSGFDLAYDVAIDRDGRAYVSGSAGGVFPGQTSQGDRDAFVRKFRPNGSSNWTRQFGTSGSDEAYGVAVDRSGRIYVVGEAEDVFPGESSEGKYDAYVRRYGPDGKALWTRQFGSDENDYANRVATDGGGRIYVVGRVGGAVPGQTSQGLADAFVRKVRPDGKTVWARQFGSSESDVANDVALDGSGRAYVTGGTQGAFPGRTSAGDGDAYVRKHR